MGSPANDATGITALVCGASGLVGGECLTRLLAHPGYSKVRIVTRRDLALTDPSGKLEQVVVDFDRLAEWSGSLVARHVFCAMGTTMKKAGSRESFRRVDFEYPLELARLARSKGAQHLSLVSSLGADPNSSVFYSRVKGELEAAVGQMGWPGVTILRPSVIEGPRQESRPLERLSRWVLASAPAKYRSVRSVDIAGAMIDSAIGEMPGVTVVESRDIPRDPGGGARG